MFCWIDSISQSNITVPHPSLLLHLTTRNHKAKRPTDNKRHRRDEKGSKEEDHPHPINQENQIN